MTRNSAGGFQWADGSPDTYQNWAPGEPSDGWDGRIEDCVLVHDNGLWMTKLAASPGHLFVKFIKLCKIALTFQDKIKKFIHHSEKRVKEFTDICIYILRKSSKDANIKG